MFDFLEFIMHNLLDNSSINIIMSQSQHKTEKQIALDSNSIINPINENKATKSKETKSRTILTFEELLQDQEFLDIQKIFEHLKKNGCNYTMYQNEKNYVEYEKQKKIISSKNKNSLNSNLIKFAKSIGIKQCDTKGVGIKALACKVLKSITDETSFNSLIEAEKFISDKAPLFYKSLQMDETKTARVKEFLAPEVYELLSSIFHRKFIAKICNMDETQFKHLANKSFKLALKYPCPIINPKSALIPKEEITENKKEYSDIILIPPTVNYHQAQKNFFKFHKEYLPNTKPKIQCTESGIDSVDCLDKKKGKTSTDKNFSLYNFNPVSSSSSSSDESDNQSVEASLFGRKKIKKSAPLENNNQSDNWFSFDKIS